MIFIKLKINIKKILNAKLSKSLIRFDNSKILLPSVAPNMECQITKKFNSI